MADKKTKRKLTVEALKHGDAKRNNIPTAEYQSVVPKEQHAPVRIAYARGAPFGVATLTIR